MERLTFTIMDGILVAVVVAAHHEKRISRAHTYAHICARMNVRKFAKYAKSLPPDRAD